MKGKRKHKKVIGLILENIFTEFSGELIRSIRNALPENNDVRLVVFGGRSSPDADVPDTLLFYEDVFNSVYKLCGVSDIDGFIVQIGGMNEKRDREFARMIGESYDKIPKVYICTAMKDCVSVNYDNETGICEAVNTLVNVMGLTRICMLGGYEGNIDAEERRSIFFRLLDENGVKYDENSCIATNMSVDCIREAGILLDRNPRAQAVFCVNDAVAVGLYAAMEERGLVPGRDILVFGFDNMHLAGRMKPSLSSIGCDNVTLGQKALELICRMADGDEVTSAKVPTRLYGRESFIYEMYDYSMAEIVRADTPFFYRMFDDCFYRYKNEQRDREPVNLRRLFYEILSRMFRSMKNRYMSIEEFGEVTRMIDIFFEKGAMEYTDADRFVKCIEKLQGNLNVLVRTASSMTWVNRLFQRMRNDAICKLADMQIERNRGITEGREEMRHFLTLSVPDHGDRKENLRRIVGNIDKLGSKNAALYLYDEPVHYDPSGMVFPEYIKLHCVMLSGELNIIHEERQRCKISEIFRRDELISKCRGFTVYALFFKDLIYGLFVCELTNEIYNRGEYIAMQLSRALYINDCGGEHSALLN